MIYNNLMKTNYCRHHLLLRLAKERTIQIFNKTIKSEKSERLLRDIQVEKICQKQNRKLNALVKLPLEVNLFTPNLIVSQSCSMFHIRLLNNKLSNACELCVGIT